jgi:hypothetical protein
VTKTMRPYEWGASGPNPRWHDRGPFAWKIAAGRPQGSFATVAEAVADAPVGAAICVTDGGWIQGWVEAETA